MIEFIMCLRETTGGREFEHTTHDSARSSDNTVDVELGGTVRLVGAKGAVKIDGRQADVIVEESSKKFSPSVVDACAGLSHLPAPKPQQPSANAPRTSKRRGWTAVGRVVDAMKKPIHNAVVTVEPTDAVVQDGPCRARVRTDQQGNFEFCTRTTDAESTTLTLDIAVDDHNFPPAPWSFWKDDRQQIRVDTRPPEAATWDAQGQVLDAQNGKPLHGATIVADLASLPSRAECSAQAETDQYGDFHFCTSATDGQTVDVKLTVNANGFVAGSGLWKFSQGSRVLIWLQPKVTPVPKPKPTATPQPKPQPDPKRESTRRDVPWLIWGGAAVAGATAAGTYAGARAICPHSRCASEGAKSGYTALFVTQWVALIGATALVTWASVETWGRSSERRGNMSVSFSPASMSVEGRF